MKADFTPLYLRYCAEGRAPEAQKLNDKNMTSFICWCQRQKHMKV